jgi:hypothetical protein
MTTLEGLQPTKFDQSIFLPETAELAIYAQYVFGFRQALGELFLQPEFSADQVPSRFLEVIEDITPNSIQGVLRHEQNYDFIEHKPLHRRLGELAIDPSTVQQPSEEFVQDLRGQIENLPYDFSELEGYHGELAKTKYLELARTVHTMSQGEDPTWVDSAYELVKEATERPEDYQLPIESAEVLYSVCYLPGYARSLTRRVLVNNFILASLRHELGEINEDEDEIISAMHTVMKTDALTGQHWTDLNLSEEKLKQIALFSAEGLASLAFVQQKTKEGKADRIAETWYRVANYLGEIMEERSVSSEIGSFEIEDVGHCFNGFVDLDLLNALKKSREPADVVELAPPKDGTKAVILEDDSQQMRAWQGAVDKHTPHAMEPELCFSTPDEIVELANDPSVSLFLLDIQNGEDKFAGIRVGEQILRRRANMAAEGAPVSTKIIIWTTSKQSLRAATERLKPIAEELENLVPISYTFPHGGRGMGRPILELKVQLKEVGSWAW